MRSWVSSGCALASRKFLEEASPDLHRSPLKNFFYFKGSASLVSPPLPGGSESSEFRPGSTLDRRLTKKLPVWICFSTTTSNSSSTKNHLAYANPKHITPRDSVLRNQVWRISGAGFVMPIRPNSLHLPPLSFAWGTYIVQDPAHTSFSPFASTKYQISPKNKSKCRTPVPKSSSELQEPRSGKMTCWLSPRSTMSRAWTRPSYMYDASSAVSTNIC